MDELQAKKPEIEELQTTVNTDPVEELVEGGEVENVPNEDE